MNCVPGISFALFRLNLAIVISSGGIVSASMMRYFVLSSNLAPEFLNSWILALTPVNESIL